MTWSVIHKWCVRYCDNELLNIEEFRRVLVHEGNINKKTSTGSTSLHLAVMGEFPSVTQQLLEHGANPNITNNYGETPLHYAAQRNRVSSIKELLRCGVDISCKDHNQDTPLHWAVEAGSLEAAQYLIACQFSLLLDENIDSNTPLDLAKISGDKSIIKFLKRVIVGVEPNSHSINPSYATVSC